jgi:rhodanese-related sulfurtransferase
MKINFSDRKAKGNMMKKMLVSFFGSLVFAASVSAYNAAKAEQFHAFYSHMTQKACANSTLFVKADDVMKMLRENKAVTLLDVRTDAEAGVVALAAPNALHIPMERLFEKTSLDRLPSDRPILIVCHSGTRAVMAAVSLKMTGIKNVQVVKGGIVALANADSTKNAPAKD